MSPLEAGRAGVSVRQAAGQKSTAGWVRAKYLEQSHTHTIHSTRPGEGWATLPPITHARAIDWGAPPHAREFLITLKAFFMQNCIITPAAPLEPSGVCVL